MSSARAVDLQCRAEWMEKVDHQVQWNPARSPGAIVEQVSEALEGRDLEGSIDHNPGEELGCQLKLEAPYDANVPSIPG